MTCIALRHSSANALGASKIRQGLALNWATNTVAALESLFSFMPLAEMICL